MAVSLRKQCTMSSTISTSSKARNLTALLSSARLLLPLPVPTTKLAVIFLQRTAASRRSNRRRLFYGSRHQLKFPFVIGGKYVVSGAVHSTELVRVFREIEKAGQGAPGSSFADALQIPINVRGVTLPPPTGSLWI